MLASESATERLGRIGVVWRGDPHDKTQPTGRDNLLQPLFDALADRNVAAQPVVFAEEVVEGVRDQLLECDGVLVWVNPIQDGRDRMQLDAILRNVASAGVWVSAHPDVIMKMGTKDVLFQTRDLDWGTDTFLYKNVEEFRERFPARLASGEPRVLKQFRGNGGNGVWKVQLTSAPDEDTMVLVDHAMQWAGAPKEMQLRDFMRHCAEYFEGPGRMIDQPFQHRLDEGMIRCYLVRDEVVGFCHQWPKGLLADPAAREQARSAPSARPPMLGPTTPAYRSLKDKLESEWVRQMMEVVDLDTASLPVIWDADFLYGPKSASGDETYILCEINVSAVWPYPEPATEQLAEAAVAYTLAAKARRT